MRLGHALFGVFVRKDGGPRGVKRGVVVGMVEVPVGIHDEFQRGVADGVERLFELGPSGRKERIYDELAVGSVQHYHVAARAGEQGEIVRELLRLDGSRAHLRANTREHLGRRRRLLRVVRGGGAEQRCGKEVRQESAARQRGRISQHFAARGWHLQENGFHVLPAFRLRFRLRCTGVSQYTADCYSTAPKTWGPGLKPSYERLQVPRA